jgi:hypothetical protein
LGATLKTAILASLISLTLAWPSLTGHSQSRTETPRKYPNELAAYQFYQNAKWKSLEPLVSTMADVRRLLGEPSEVHDVSQYTKAYPGDALAKKPVFTYVVDDDWQILVYFVRYCFFDGPALPTLLDDRLCTIDLVPKKRIPFDKVQFSAPFKRKAVTAIDAAWDEYEDGSGLVYEVYTTRTPYGNTQPGDLNRIKYGPSAEALRVYAGK